MTNKPEDQPDWAELVAELKAELDAALADVKFHERPCGLCRIREESGQEDLLRKMRADLRSNDEELIALGKKWGEKNAALRAEVERLKKPKPSKGRTGYPWD